MEWSPIGGITSYRGGSKSTSDDPTLQQIARDHGMSAAQVMLCWHLQESRSAIPESTRPARIAENFDVFGFELTHQQLAAIDALDTVACIAGSHFPWMVVSPLRIGLASRLHSHSTATGERT